MALTIREKELVAVGASLAAGCKSCANFHFKKVREAGATDEEIQQAMTDALAVRDRAKTIMERHGYRLLGLKLGRREDDGGDGDAADTGERNRMTELVSVAAAFAVNCTSSLDQHLAAARHVGVTEDEIAAVVELARFIKGKADSLCCKLI